MTPDAIKDSYFCNDSPGRLYSSPISIVLKPGTRDSSPLPSDGNSEKNAHVHVGNNVRLTVEGRETKRGLENEEWKIPPE